MSASTGPAVFCAHEGCRQHFHEVVAGEERASTLGTMLRWFSLHGFTAVWEGEPPNAEVRYFCPAHAPSSSGES